MNIQQSIEDKLDGLSNFLLDFEDEEIRSILKKIYVDLKYGFDVYCILTEAKPSLEFANTHYLNKIPLIVKFEENMYIFGHDDEKKIIRTKVDEKYRSIYNNLHFTKEFTKIDLLQESSVPDNLLTTNSHTHNKEVFSDEIKNNICNLIQNIITTKVADEVKPLIRELKWCYTRKNERILDTLAKVLSNNSECIAIAEISNQLFIAANEIKHPDILRAPAPAIKEDLENIINFLNLNKEVKTEEELLKNNVCSRKYFGNLLKKGSGLITPNIYNEAMEAVQTKKLTNIEFKEIRQNKNVGYNVEQFSFCFMGILSQKENLHKLKLYCKYESSFLEKLSKHELLYNDHKYFDQYKVHAEMKVLKKIIDLAESDKLENTRIYIGITKSCCFHCHHTLEAAKDILAKEKNIEIVYREFHDIGFHKKSKDKQKSEKSRISPNSEQWNFPWRAKIEQDSLAYKIQTLAQDKFKKNDSAKHADQRHKNASASSADTSIHETSIIEEEIERLEAILYNLEPCVLIPNMRESAQENKIIINRLLDLYRNEDSTYILLNILTSNKDMEEIEFDKLCQSPGSDEDHKIKLLECMQSYFAHANMKKNTLSLYKNSIEQVQQKQDSSLSITTKIAREREEVEAHEPRASKIRKTEDTRNKITSTKERESTDKQLLLFEQQERLKLHSTTSTTTQIQDFEIEKEEKNKDDDKFKF